ncbi:ATP-binding protein [Methanoculleus sp. FWC-SCC1]|uniref:ATP-binding protein n=1 Tax=Methanoculleus frigidifontis TaxID=2584085 RepID=A0ABT8M8W3_9EURY|nr:ATP-binding protein [Methanoculleus sp. FWC-SCC1]MDN7024382.1 ATP-binding protein [Methanoculleus sp. FWC-SCC1]
MKIAICGKGGSGKSTLTALLAREYARRNRPVLVVDTDESNLGLHRLLGTNAPPDLMDYFGGKKAMGAKIMAAMPDFASVNLIEEAWTLDGLPKDYVAEDHGVRLAAIGKIHDAGEGCACPMGILARQFLGSLRLGDDDVVIADTEAGIEHFGRGIDQEGDVILMVLDPSFESLRLAEKIAEMAGNIGVPLYYVLNKADTAMAARMREGIADPSRIICEIPQEPGILEAGLGGQALTDGHPAVKTLIEALDEHAE